MENLSNGGRARGRIEWDELRRRIDLAAVATNLLGPAPGRRGERGRRLWWPCPFHQDANPSFCIDPQREWWRCYGCQEKGDAANLVMRRLGLSFPEAVRWLDGFAGGLVPALPGGPRPRPIARGACASAPRIEAGPEGMAPRDALALMERAADRLWTSDGAAALERLRARGLTDETIRQARLGYDPAVRATTRDGRPYTARGIVIPWIEDGRLTLLKVRQPEGGGPKYAQVYRNRPRLYVAAPIWPGRPAVVTEGEFDALALAQLTADWRCGVVTTGSASTRPDAELAGRMVAASPWLLAHDADEAGDRAADAWMELSRPRCRRVRPPFRGQGISTDTAGGKDWSDLHRMAPNAIRYHLAPLLSTGPSWEALQIERWAGPTDDDEPPGILAGS